MTFGHWNQPRKTMTNRISTIALYLAVLMLAAFSDATAQAADVSQLKPMHRIVNDPEASVEIVSYKWKKKAVSVRDGATRSVIQHEVKYKSLHDTRPISAVEFGFVSFSAWDEFLAHQTGTHVDILFQHEETAKWISHLGDFREDRMYSGFVYVSRIRWSDGEIWTSDRSAVRDAVRAVYQKELPEDTIIEQETEV